MGPCVLKSRKGKKRKKKETELNEMKKKFSWFFFLLQVTCTDDKMWRTTNTNKIIFEDSMICSSSKF